MTEQAKSGGDMGDESPRGPLPFRLYVVTDAVIAGGERKLVERVGDVARAAGAEAAVYVREEDDDLARRVEEAVAAFGCGVFRRPMTAKGPMRRQGGIHLPAAWSGSAIDARAGMPERRVGRSVHSAEEARRASEEGCDFAVFGHVFPTGSKPGEPPRGVDGLRAACEAAAQCPVFAIGGMRPENVREALDAGAFGVAAIRGLLDSAHPGRMAESFLHALRAHPRPARNVPAGALPE